MVIALTGLAAFIAGAAFGVFIYSHLYQHFSKEIEAKAKKQWASDMIRKKMIEQKILETRRKLRDMYGDDLSAKHQEVVDEEIEKILSAGPS